MRVKVFLFAAITAALALPVWAKSQRLEKPQVDPESEEVKGAAPTRQKPYDGYGFAPSLEPSARRWKKQWRADRQFERTLAKRGTNPFRGNGKPVAQSAKVNGSSELPPYWAFAEPHFAPAGLFEAATVLVDAPRQ